MVLARIAYKPSYPSIEMAYAGIDTTVSRLEQLVLAEFRTHFVTFKVSTLLCFLLYSTLLYCTHATLLHSTLL